MPRKYCHIRVYEQEITELRAQGKTRKEIMWEIQHQQNVPFLRYREVAIMTMSNGWIYRHEICLLQKRYGNVRINAERPTDTAVCTLAGTKPHP